jgi:hypothetical protein
VKRKLALSVTSLFISISAWSQDKSEFGPKPLDGSTIEALEIYRNPKGNELTFGLGVFPFNPYYSGFSAHAGYSIYFNKSTAWEVLNGYLVKSVEKSLTTDLAQNFSVNPTQIERLNFVLSSNMLFFHSYGKFIFLSRHIEYFRTAFLVGLAMVKTNQQSRLAASFGLRFGIYANDTFSWKIDIRDHMTFSGGVENFIAFTFGTGIGF